MRERIHEVTIDGDKHKVHRHGNNLLQVEGANGAKKFHPHEDKEAGYLMTVANEYIITTGLNDKIIKFWKVSQLLEGDDSTEKPFYSWKNSKKVTSLHWLEFTLDGRDIKGIIYADKFGEVRFFNIDNLPKEQEESKENNDEVDEEKENNTTLLFGHQYTISHLEMAKDKKLVFTVDAVKVKVTHFPECVCVHSVAFHGMKEVTGFSVVNDNHILAFSNSERWLKVWRVQEDALELVKEYKSTDFSELAKHEVQQGDTIKLERVDEDGSVVCSLYSAQLTKALVLKIDLD